MSRLILATIIVALFGSMIQAEVFDYSFSLGELEVCFTGHNWDDGKSELGLGLLSNHEIYSTNFFVEDVDQDWQLTFQIEGLLDRQAVSQSFFQTVELSKDGTTWQIRRGIDSWWRSDLGLVNLAYLNLVVEPGRLTSCSWDYYEFVCDHQYGADERQFFASFGLLFHHSPEPASISLVALGGLILLRRKA
jgi:hypothetical protein